MLNLLSHVRPQRASLAGAKRTSGAGASYPVQPSDGSGQYTRIPLPGLWSALPVASAAGNWTWALGAFLSS